MSSESAKAIFFAKWARNLQNPHLSDGMRAILQAELDEFAKLPEATFEADIERLRQKQLEGVRAVRSATISRREYQSRIEARLRLIDGTGKEAQSLRAELWRVSLGENPDDQFTTSYVFMRGEDTGSGHEE